MRFDPDVVGVRTLLRLIEKDLGYPARLDDGEDSSGGGGGDPAEADRRFWLRRFAWGALFAVPTFLLAMVRSAIKTSSLLTMTRSSLPKHVHERSPPILAAALRVGVGGVGGAVCCAHLPAGHGAHLNFNYISSVKPNMNFCLKFGARCSLCSPSCWP